tara:strand:- start:4409 stop:4957 length:549 start_codon:yes stop_codon:yes gene_type:complete
MSVIYENGIGYDVASRLLKENIIMVNGQVDDFMADDVISKMLLLDHADKGDIHMYINTGGGSVTAGLAIIDTMNLVGCDVNTYCMGMCASMGACILSQGTKGKRLALPNSHVMIHQVSAGTSGAVDDMIRTVEFAKSLNGRLASMIAKSTKKTLKRVKADMDRDYYMNAEEALAYGIIDQIL